MNETVRWLGWTNQGAMQTVQRSVSRVEFF